MNLGLNLRLLLGRTNLILYKIKKKKLNKILKKKIEKKKLKKKIKKNKKKSNYFKKMYWTMFKLCHRL